MSNELQNALNTVGAAPNELAIRRVQDAAQVALAERMIGTLKEVNTLLGAGDNPDPNWKEQVHAQVKDVLNSVEGLSVV